MKRIDRPKQGDWADLLKRPIQSVFQIEGLVEEVFQAVKNQGDRAVKNYTDRFDQVQLDDFLVSPAEIERASAQVGENLQNAILLAKSNIEKFHAAQRTPEVRTQTMPGVLCWQQKRPIQKVGLYIPGGTAPLFSTVLMLGVPAQLAGCREIILCTPPDTEGKIHPAILYTAALCGIDKIYRVGGIQAIAAMCFGTESIPAVHKIFGPGNQYVTVAKQVATKYGLAIDIPAGPSELMVLADDSAVPDFVASDLLSQAEHGVDSQVILVSTSGDLIDAVQKEIDRQLPALPRAAIAQKAMANSRSILMGDLASAMDLVNRYGPEHLILCHREVDQCLDRLENAGSVFIGNYTPESAGDYASGTNHTLPTSGHAKAYGGVNLDSFTKSMTFQEISPEGILGIGKAIELMAGAEGLQAHKNAVTLRLDSLRKDQ